MAVAGNYITESDIDNWASEATDAQKLATIQRAESLVERITRDYFYAKSFNITLNGNGKNQLFLGLMPDILSITEIKISGVVLDAGLYSFDNNSVFRAALATAQCRDIENITLSGTDPVSVTVTNHGFTTGETARLIQVTGITPSLDGEYGVTKVGDNTFTLNNTDSSDYTGTFSSGTVCFATLAELHYLTDSATGVFPRGVKNVSIAGTYGWTSCPASIKEAVVMLCKYDNDNTLYTSYGDMKSERLGDYSYTRDSGEKFLTGIEEADKLIRNYIRRKPLLGAV